MEGQSFTVVPTFKGKKLTGAYVCSRNNAYKVPDNSIFWDMMRKYDIVAKMKDVYKKTGKAYIFQGEQVGPTIQQNIYNFAENDWYVFTVKDYNTGKQLPPEEAIKVATADFDLHFVPVIQSNVKLKDIMPDVSAAVAVAEKAAWTRKNGELKINYEIQDKDKIWDDYLQHEGVVVRSMNYDKDNNIGCSFKVKNSDYAEKGLGKMAEIAKKM